MDATHLASLVGYCIVVVRASLVKVPELGVAHELGTCRIHFVIRHRVMLVLYRECLGSVNGHVSVSGRLEEDFLKYRLYGAFR